MSTELTSPSLRTVPWDGLWDLDNDDEMLAMLKSLMRVHEAALMKIGDDWQMGWKGAKIGQIWGLRLRCPRSAIRDATERLFKKIKGQDVVNGDSAPNPSLCKGVPHDGLLSLLPAFAKVKKRVDKAGDVADFEHSGVWCCTEKSNCQWQGFALHQGLAWGTVTGSTTEWLDRHSQNCRGRLIQLIPANVQADPQNGRRKPSTKD